MNDGKSDTHGIHQSLISEKNLLQLSKRYLLTKPLQQMTVLEFLDIAVLHDCKKKLKIRRGNSNTACPSYLIFPNGILEIYISNPDTRCGRIQLLYWYFKYLYHYPSSILNTNLPIFTFEDASIIVNDSIPLDMDMDEKDIAMHYAKSMLKILR